VPHKDQGRDTLTDQEQAGQEAESPQSFSPKDLGRLDRLGAQISQTAGLPLGGDGLGTRQETESGKAEGQELEVGDGHPMGAEPSDREQTGIPQEQAQAEQDDISDRDPPLAEELTDLLPSDPSERSPPHGSCLSFVGQPVDANHGIPAGPEGLEGLPPARPRSPKDDAGRIPEAVRGEA
jgi:hypothetical protein